MTKILFWLQEILKMIIRIICVYSIYILFQFIKLHILYYPETHDLIVQEIIVLIGMAIMFLGSSHYKMKYTKIVAGTTLILGIQSMIIFKVASMLI